MATGPTRLLPEALRNGWAEQGGGHKWPVKCVMGVIWGAPQSFSWRGRGLSLRPGAAWDTEKGQSTLPGRGATLGQPGP